MRRIPWVPVFFLALGMQGAWAEPKATDVSGIKVGVPLAAQRDAIAKINPNYQLNDIKLANGKLLGVLATARKDGTLVDHFLAVQDDDGTVWYVERGQEYAKGERIRKDVLLNSLKDKYGQEYTDVRWDYAPQWEYDRHNNLYKGIRGPCADLENSYIGRIEGFNVSVPTSFTESCGLKIETSMSFDSEDADMVSRFVISITDPKHQYDVLSSRAAKEEADEKARKQRLLESEKANKPKL